MHHLHAAVCLLATGVALPVWADAVTDGTAGPRVRLGGDFEIGADLGTRAGRNLFHSFERFSLATGERATFTGPDDIRNVISRVTGGEPSDIDGTIRSTIAGADFYFLNPAGVVFGPNASLDLQGSLHVATAAELRFADGARFSASDPAASSFTVAAPEAFGFLRGAPAEVSLFGSSLAVPDGQEISVSGGTLLLSGAELVATQGDIGLSVFGSGAPNPTTGLPTGFVLLNGARVDASGDRGGRVSIVGNEIIIGGSGVLAINFGDRDGTGGIEIAGGSVLVTAGSIVATRSAGAGAAGPVSISGAAVTVARDATISADAFAAGDAGVVIVRATDIAVLSGGQIGSATFSSGDAGRVRIVSDTLTIDGAGTSNFTGITSQGTFQQRGNAGSVEVTSGKVLILDGSIRSSTFGVGRGGTITISADDLRLEDGSEISAIALVNDAGTITLEIKDELRLSDSAIATQSLRSGGGITLTVGDLILLADGSQVTSSILSDMPGDRAGDITIDPRFLILDRSSILARAGAGQGGDIMITADQLLVSPGSAINAEAGEEGIDGTVVISSPEVDLSGGLVVLEGALLDAGSQLRERCGARRDIDASSFTGVGRGGLPPTPDGALAGAYVAATPSDRGGPAGRATMASSFDRPMLVAAPCRGAP